MNKGLSKITIDAPVSVFIGISYRRARDFTPNAHVVKLFSHSSQAAFNIAKRFAISQLSKSHTHELIKACKRANAVIAVVAINASTKFFNRQGIHDLRKYGLSIVH
jgi:hypothetical protein